MKKLYNEITVLFLLMAVIAVFGFLWANLRSPGNVAKASVITATIGEKLAQEEIRTDSMQDAASASKKTRERTLPVIIAGINAVIIAFVVLAILMAVLVGGAISGKLVSIQKQACMPAISAIGDGNYLLQVGGVLMLHNGITGTVRPIATTENQEQNYAEIMGRILLAREFGSAAVGIAEHTGDNAVGNYLMGQIETISHDSITP